MNKIFNYLDELIPDYYCELNYNNDFEFLIAVVLSAQTTDSKVNKVTEELFKKYDITSLSNANINEIKNILLPLGMANKKAVYIKNIASYIKNNNGVIPRDRNTLMSLDGVGRKTANLVLATLYNEPYLAVDTHVKRVSERLGITSVSDDALKVEEKLCKIIPKEDILKRHHQLVLFGRYYCKSKNPSCNTCKLKNICKNSHQV